MFQIVRLIGNVASQTTVPMKIDLDQRRNQRRRGDSTSAHPAKKSTAAKSTIVGGPLYVPPCRRGPALRFDLGPVGLARLKLVFGHHERRERRIGIHSGSVTAHAYALRRPELFAEAVIEVGELGLVLRVGVDPLGKRSHIDLGLRVGERVCLARLDTGRPARLNAVACSPFQRLAW